MTDTLHERLIARQPLAELERKWAKAEGRWSNQFWSQEWLDLSKRQAEKLVEFFANDGQSPGE